MRCGASASGFRVYCRAFSLIVAGFLSIFLWSDGARAHVPHCAIGDTSTGNTLLAFADLANSNPNTELAFVQQTVPNAVIVPCTFSPSGEVTSGTWSSNQTVTHITLKAARITELFSVTQGMFGTWSTGCNVNQNDKPHALSHGRCYASGTQTGDTGTITVIKETKDGFGTFGFTIDGDGTSNDSNFSLTTSPGNNPFSSGAIVKPTGDYVIKETSLPPNWELDSITCTSSTGAKVLTDKDQRTATVKLSTNENITCTFKNAFKGNTGKITIKKKALGGNGTFDFSGGLGNFSLSPNDGQTVQFGPITTSTGQYTISEDIPPGWTLKSRECRQSNNQPIGAASGDNGVTFQLGDNGPDSDITCTFVNEKQKGKIIVEKESVDGDGNTKFYFTGGLGNFSLQPQANGTVSTAFPNLTPGTFVVTETPVPGWTTMVKCTDPSNDSTPGSTFQATNVATIKVGAGETVTCRFKNVRQKGTIVIAKTAVNGDGATYFEFTGTLGAFSLKPPANGTVYKTFDNLTPGNYSVTETAVDGWKTTLECVDPTNNTTVNGATGTIKLSPGETVTCTYTNKRQTGSIIVKKVTIGGDGKFNFAVNGPGTNQTFELMNGGQQSFSSLFVGQYTIEEVSLPAGWTLKSATCGQGTKDNNKITVTLDPYETIECTFTNFKEKDDPMDEVTKAFVHRRVDNLLSHGPDRSRLLRRLQEQGESLKDSPLKFSNEAGLGAPMSSRLGFGASGFANSSFERFGFAPPGSVNSTFGQSSYERYFGSGDGGVWQDDPDANDGSGSPGTISMLGATTNFSSQFKFSTSLSELRAAAQAAEAKKEERKLADAGMSFSGQPYTRPGNWMRPGLDFWVEGQRSNYEDSTGGINRDGSFTIFYMGADFPISQNVLLGALVQLDWTREDIKEPDLFGEISGKGWMAGPYVGIKLQNNLFFDARVAWGTSENDIVLTDDVVGTRTAKFDTTRWLASASLTGNYYYGPWRVTPQVGVAYGNESYDDFKNSLGQTVDGASISIGRFTGGAEVGYRMMLRDGTYVEPHVGLTGIWNFDSDDLVIDGAVVTPNRTRARVEGGVIMRNPSGTSVRAAVAYDGLGDSDFNALTGKFWLNLPFN